MASINFSLGLNRVNPPIKLLAQQNGEIECSILENLLCGNNRLKKVGGTQNYNATSLGSDRGIPWVERSYHIRGDSSIVKYTLCFYNGAVYSGNDVNGTLAVTNATGLTPTSIPLSETFQVSGNSLLFLFTGSDTPYKFDGNGGTIFELTGLSDDYVGAVSHLQRMWYWSTLSSSLDYSNTLTPETISASILVGDNAKDSYIIACILMGNERFFVFKNNSIWELFGRTTSTFQFRRITNQFGLASKRALYPVGGGIIFLNQYDKELYFFGGTEASIKPITEDTIRLREIMNQTVDSINNCCMTTHKNYFRFAFQHVSSTIDSNDSELVYPLNDPRADGTPKWSLIRGSRVYSYSRWTREGDQNELVTGRSDLGRLVYHDRGNDWAGDIIQTRVRTGEIQLSEDKVARLGDMIVKGKPGSVNLDMVFRYYMNGRFPNSSDAQDYLPRGETRTVGTVILHQSDLYNRRIIPRTKYALGNSVSFELEDNHLGTDVELYSIAFTAKERYKIRNALVGNVRASDL